jgi:cell division septum initiation protein DivIVA
MNASELHIKRIHDKLQQLLKQYVAMQKENKQLKEELDLAQQKVSAQQKIADELKQQVSILKLSNGEMNETEKKEFEKRIHSYLKEIDRCIAMLESN